MISNFLDAPEIAFHIFTAAWPKTLAKRLAARETDELGMARDQISNRVYELDNPHMVNLIRAFQVPPPSISAEVISFKALREELPLKVVHDYFQHFRLYDVTR